MWMITLACSQNGIHSGRYLVFPLHYSLSFLPVFIFGKDSYIIIHDNLDAEFISLAGKINRSMPAWVISRISDFLRKKGKKSAIKQKF